MTVIQAGGFAAAPLQRQGDQEPVVFPQFTYSGTQMIRPIADFLSSSSRRSELGWTVLRLMVAVIIGAHGWTRLLNWEFSGLGEWLTSQGIPFGLAIAATVTFLEAAGSILLALRVFVLPLALSFSFIYAVGIVMVHAPDGWFVVGKGRNGAEFSVLLIVALLCVALQHVPVRRAA